MSGKKRSSEALDNKPKKGQQQPQQQKQKPKNQNNNNQGGQKLDNKPKKGQQQPQQQQQKKEKDQQKKEQQPQQQQQQPQQSKKKNKKNKKQKQAQAQAQAQAQVQEPQTKKQKVEEPEPEEQDQDDDAEDEKIPKELEDLKEISDELQELTSKEEQEIRQLKQKHLPARRGAFERRSKVIEKIDSFWATALSNHPMLKQLFEDSDKELLQHLKTLDVTETIVPTESFKLTMTFTENSVVSSKTIWREFINENDELKLKQSIKWADSSVTEESSNGAFQTLFSSNEEEALQLAECIRDVYDNALEYYLDIASEEDFEISDEDELNGAFADDQDDEDDDE